MQGGGDQPPQSDSPILLSEIFQATKKCRVGGRSCKMFFRIIEIVPLSLTWVCIFKWDYKDNKSVSKSEKIQRILHHLSFQQPLPLKKFVTIGLCTLLVQCAF